jgi:hypothetical protein
MALVYKPAITRSHMTGVYAEQRVLGKLAEAFFHRPEIGVSLQDTKLVEGVDVDAVKIAVRRA